MREDFAISAAEKFGCPVAAILNLNELTEQERLQLPAWWLEIVGLTPTESIQLTMGHWNRVLPDEMRRLHNVVEQYCHDVGLVRLTTGDYNGLALLYGFDTPKGRVFLVGYPPAHSKSSIFSKMPRALSEFYLELHDGLHYDPISDPVGVYKVEKLVDWESWVGSSELSYLSYPPPDIPPLAKNLILFYTDGSGGYILFNTDPNGLVAWTVGSGLIEEETRDLWDVVDDWIALVLTGDFYD